MATRLPKAGIQLIYGMEVLSKTECPSSTMEVDMELSDATYVVFDVETTGLQPFIMA